MTRSLATTPISGLSLEAKYSLTAFDPDQNSHDPDRRIRSPEPSVSPPGALVRAESATLLLQIVPGLASGTWKSGLVGPMAVGSLLLALKARINVLRKDGRLDGIEAQTASEHDLTRFLVSNRLRRPLLVLSDDGEFRAVWKGDQGERIAVLFHGSGRGEVVLFGPASSDQHRDDLVARRSVGAIPSLVEDAGLASVWRRNDR